MSDDVVIRARGVGKRYLIGKKREPYGALRDALVGGAKRFLTRRADQPATDSEVWALRDVSFEVRRGEVLGVIGRNGAGKSTLLKVLSRITAPTSGEIEIRGRVGSLLEVGTGFHPELTGRENIFVNGSLLGMTRVEIKKKFDEIVEFSGVDKFLDTPVKRYSSGMQVRLAFAVAAHLEPEILLVDEVLAVGDVEFQKKCLGKMGEIAKGGRTVLFVSHNMAAIATLCRSALLMSGGMTVFAGDVRTAITQYTAENETSGIYEKPANQKRGKFSIERVSLTKDSELSTTFLTSDTLSLKIESEASENIKGAQVAFELLTALDEVVFSSSHLDSLNEIPTMEKGRNAFVCRLDLGFLRAGRYRIAVSSSIPGLEALDVPDRTVGFDLIDNTSPIIRLGQGRRGLILPILPWTWEFQGSRELLPAGKD